MTERCQKSSVTLLIESLQTTLGVLRQLVTHVESLRMDVNRITELEERIASLEDTINTAYSLTTMQQSITESTNPVADIATARSSNIIDINRGLFAPIDVEKKLPLLVAKVNKSINNTLIEAEIQHKESISRTKKRKRE